MKRNLIIHFLLLTFTIFLSGCWSHKELTELALVAALGIDRNEEGKYLITLQLVNAGNVEAGKQGGQTSPVTVFTSQGDNLVEASRKASQSISRRLYYAHTNIVVISEALAKEEGINTIFDALERDSEFRTTTVVVIAHNTTAKSIVNTLTSIEKIPANKVLKTLKSAEKRWGEFMSISIQDVISALVSEGKEPVISGFTIKGNVEKGKKLEGIQQTSPAAGIEANGLAVFKEGKLIEWYKGESARGTTFVLDKISATAVNIDWNRNKQAIAYQLTRQKTKVKANKMKDSMPVITIHVKAEGDIGEVTVPIDITNPKIILEIENLIEKEIKNEINLAVQRAQENQTDIFGFGEAVHIADPKLWNKLKDNWNEQYFPRLEVKVRVDAFVRRTGLRNKSYISNMKNDE